MNDVDLKKYSKELQGTVDEYVGQIAALACENE